MGFLNIAQICCIFAADAKANELMDSDFKTYLLTTTRSSSCTEVEVIQSLWSNYGKIVRYKLDGGARRTVVIKSIFLDQATDHPRGWNTSFSHRRKVRSYEIETCWYEHWSAKCPSECPVPAFIGSFSKGKKQWIILEDLNQNYPLRKYSLTRSEIEICLRWLAHFHATFLQRPPTGLWETGTYWHLATRPDEFEKIADSRLKAKAATMDTLLNQCAFQTIVHGDAKLANFCFSEDGRSVAAVDFQYVGGGCGMKDVAYFLSSCLSGAECERYETELLDTYFLALKEALAKSNQVVDFQALETEWRNMYPVAVADFTRFLMGWMPDHQKVNRYSRRLTQLVVDSL